MPDNKTKSQNFNNSGIYTCYNQFLINILINVSKEFPSLRVWKKKKKKKKKKKSIKVILSIFGKVFFSIIL